MNPRCTELNRFFDSELEADAAAAFRDHLATCERCQRVLLGRMQEFVIIARDAAGGSTSATGRSAAVDVVFGNAFGNPATALVAARSWRAPPAVIGRRWSGLRYLVPVVAAAAAAVPLVLLHERDNGAVTFTSDIEHQEPRVRGKTHVGDVLRSTVHGGHYRALWVYFEDRELVVACPDDEGCRQDGDGLTVHLTLAQRGRYIVIGLCSEGVSSPPARENTIERLLAAQPDYKLEVLQVLDVD